MPFIAIRRDVRDKIIELAKKEQEDPSSWNKAYYYGFMDALNYFLTSEQKGMMICDKDCALEGEELYTDMLPKLVIGAEND